jgi:hypothetical protein
MYHSLGQPEVSPEARAFCGKPRSSQKRCAMSRLLKVKEFENRKRALVMEAEVYRQSLLLQAQNIRLCAVQMRRKYTSVKPSNPLLLLLAPLAAGLMRRKQSSGKSGWVSKALFAWQFIRKFAPMIRPLLSRFGPRSSAPREQDKAPAANI